MLHTLLVAGLLQVSAAQLDSAISTQVPAGFSGVVLVARGDSILLEKAYGRAEATGARARDLAFWMASNSKQYTAAAILRLHEMGKLRLTDSLSRFFPTAPTEKRGITVHQLLTHTSGLANEYSADGVANREEAIAKALKLDLKSRPGEKYAYSNDGFALLALIVEVAGGTPFDSFMTDSIFRRAGLTRTGVWGHEQPDLVIAPVANQQRLRTVRKTIYLDGHSVANWGYRGPTGVYATAHDAYEWMRALQKGRALSPESVKLLVGRHFVVRSDSTGTSYVGYGWGTRVEGGRDVSYGHLGNEDWLGHNGVIRWTPEGDVVVVFSNSGDVDGSGWASRVNSVIRRVVAASTPGR